MTKYRKLTPGAPLNRAISASTWNAFVDALNSKELGNQSPPPATSSVVALRQLVKASTGAAVSPGHVVGLGAPVFDPATNVDSFRNRLVLEGDTIDYKTHHSQFAVFEYGARDGAIKAAIVGGFAKVKVNILHADHDRAFVVTGTGEMQTGWHGAAKIIWKESGTGADKWAVIEMLHTDQGEVKAVADAEIVAGSGALASVWRNGVDTGDNITVTLNWMHSSQNISLGKELVARWFADEDKWIVLGAECE